MQNYNDLKWPNRQMTKDAGILTLREMTASDARSVAEIHTKSWQFAYRGIVDQSFLDSLNVQKRVENWRKGIINNEPKIVRLVAEANGKVLGFVCGLDNRTKNLIPQCDAELWAIYVEPNQAREGIGKELLKEFSRNLKVLGKGSFCVWALKENQIARSFYQKQGGALSPISQKIKIGEQDLEEVSYIFSL